MLTASQPWFPSWLSAATDAEAPGARVGGSQYVLHRDVIDWLPGPGWVQALVLVALFLVYRIAAWGEKREARWKGR